MASNHLASPSTTQLRSGRAVLWRALALVAVIAAVLTVLLLIATSAV
ncbi:hypothetical protein [Gordonia shandongensis]|nr:hypothetical protein [Gordonia shandongensis]